MIATYLKTTVQHEHGPHHVITRLEDFVPPGAFDEMSEADQEKIGSVLADVHAAMVALESLPAKRRGRARESLGTLVCEPPDRAVAIRGIISKTKTYQIIETRPDDDPAQATYQVVDDEGQGQCKNEVGALEPTPSFTLAVERYCELTGADPATIDSPHEARR